MKKHEKRSARHGHWYIAPAAMLLLVGAILADSRWHLSSEEYDLYFSRLPEGFDGFRIVQISDLHEMEFGTDNSRLVEKVRELKPDLIALTGDFIEEKTPIWTVEKLCRSLTEIAPVYFVSGNHDVGSRKLRELKTALEYAGVNYLANQYVPLYREGDHILVCGVEDRNAYADMPAPDAVVQRLRAEHPDDFVLFLGHRNDWPEKYPLLDVDLILSGHGHGGIVRLPFVGGIFGTNARLFPEYDAGVFPSRTYTMVVSRGLGNVPFCPRFLNPPDLPVIVLHGK